MAAERNGDLNAVCIKMAAAEDFFALFKIKLAKIEREVSVPCAHDDRALRSVEQGADTRAGAHASDRNEHTADNVVRELHQRAHRIVTGAVFRAEELVVAVSENLGGVARKPAQKIHGVASAAREAVARIFVAVSPVNGHGAVIVGVFGFYVNEITDHALVHDLLCLHEGGCLAADLADHQLRLGLAVGIQHPLAVLQRQRKGLFAEHVLACMKEVRNYLRVQMVGYANDGNVNIILVKKLVIIGAVGNVVECGAILGPFLVDLANVSKLGLIVGDYRS